MRGKPAAARGLDRDRLGRERVGAQTFAEPSAIRMRVALGESWMPAPVSSSRSACLQQCDAESRSRQHQRRAQSPDPAPAMMTLREDATAGAPSGQTASVRAQASGRAACGSSAGSCRYSVEQYGQMISLSPPMSRKT
jgi:hypothetical protein